MFNHSVQIYRPLIVPVVIKILIRSVFVAEPDYVVSNINDLAPFGATNFGPTQPQRNTENA